MPNPYVQFTWVDGATAITAARLNNMELGINDASVQAYAAIAKPASPTTNAILYWTGAAWAQQLLLNANVAAAAGIDVTKLALGAADQVLSSTGAANSWSGTTGANARVAVRKNSGATTGTRRRLNLVEGSNIAITLADDAGNEEVAVTIAATTSIPAGVMWMTGAAAASTGWVLCDGNSYPRTGGTFDALFAAIGTSYGFVDGTHFNVPNFQGRMAVGKGTHTDVDTLGKVEPGSLPLGSRRPRHNSTRNGAVSKTGSVGGSFVYAFVNNGFPNGNFLRQNGSVHTASIGGSDDAYTAQLAGVSDGIGISDTVTIGPQTSAEPVDTPAYVVVNYMIKL